MRYFSVSDARRLPGVRLVLTSGSPGPWSEAAKAILRVRGIAFIPVKQHVMAVNEELVEWAGHRNAPILCVDDEPPLATWLEILLRAERLGDGLSLLPDDPNERALCLGYVTEIASNDGLGWNHRLEQLQKILGNDGTRRRQGYHHRQAQSPGDMDSTPKPSIVRRCGSPPSSRDWPIS
jgi:hypothetical protein